MLAQEQMRYGAQIMAAMFGGPGIFYIIESFGNAGNALTGLIYLGAATGLLLMGQGKGDAVAARGGILARAKEVIRAKTRRS